MAKYSSMEQAKAKEHLQKLLKPGGKIYCIDRTPSLHARSRTSFDAIDSDGVPHSLDRDIAVLFGLPEPNRGLDTHSYTSDLLVLINELGRRLFNDPNALTRYWL